MNASVLYSTALCLYFQNFSIYILFFNRCTQGFCRGKCASWEWNSCRMHTFPHTTYLRGPEQPTAILYSGLCCSCHLESETFSLPPFFTWFWLLLLPGWLMELPSPAEPEPSSVGLLSTGRSPLTRGTVLSRWLANRQLERVSRMQDESGERGQHESQQDLGSRKEERAIELRVGREYNVKKAQRRGSQIW